MFDAYCTLKNESVYIAKEVHPKVLPESMQMRRRSEFQVPPEIVWALFGSAPAIYHH
jgi:hypothetical protein